MYPQTIGIGCCRRTKKEVRDDKEKDEKEKEKEKEKNKYLDLRDACKEEHKIIHVFSEEIGRRMSVLFNSKVEHDENTTCELK